MLNASTSIYLRYISLVGSRKNIREQKGHGGAEKAGGTKKVI